MTHKFIVNTENVNTVGYRILTSGIDYEQYLRNPVVLHMHDRHNPAKRGQEVVGRCLRLYVEDTNLVAEIEFDENDDFAKTIAGKVERGFLRMASLYAEVIEATNDPEYLLPGQIYETVTKCKLVEISIVDIGGNDDALKLSLGGETKLKKLILNNEDKMSKLLTIALALGMSAESSEENILKEVQSLKLAKTKSDEKANELEVKLQAIQNAESQQIVDKLIQLSLLPEALKETQMKALAADFDTQKVVLNKLIQDKEAELIVGGKHAAVREVILGRNTGSGKGIELSFDYLQKHDPAELRRIHQEEPDKYARLAKEYAGGKRYTEKSI